MRSLRDIKRKARRDLHNQMKVAALYLAAPGDAGVSITVRIHTKWDALGIQNAENGLAVRRESKPKLIFMLDEMQAAGVTVKRGAIVSVERGEAYKLDNAEAPDDITVTFIATAMSAEQTVDLPIPVTSNG